MDRKNKREKSVKIQYGRVTSGRINLSIALINSLLISLLRIGGLFRKPDDDNDDLAHAIVSTRSTTAIIKSAFRLTETDGQAP